MSDTWGVRTRHWPQQPSRHPKADDPSWERATATPRRRIRSSSSRRRERERRRVDRKRRARPQRAAGTSRTYGRTLPVVVSRLLHPGHALPSAGRYAGGEPRRRYAVAIGLVRPRFQQAAQERRKPLPLSLLLETGHVRRASDLRDRIRRVESRSSWTGRRARGLAMEQLRGNRRYRCGAEISRHTCCPGTRRRAPTFRAAPPPRRGWRNTRTR